MSISLFLLSWLKVDFNVSGGGGGGAYFMGEMSLITMYQPFLELTKSKKFGIEEVLSTPCLLF